MPDEVITTPATPAETPAATPTTPTPPEKTFTQADLDRIVSERLQREKSKAEEAVKKTAADAEAKALAEQGEFKALYEKLKADNEAAQVRIRAMELDNLRSTVGRKLGLPDALHSRLQGEDEAAIEADAQSLLAGLTLAQSEQQNGTRFVTQHAGSGAQKPVTTKDVADSYISKTYKRG